MFLNKKFEFYFIILHGDIFHKLYLNGSFFQTWNLSLIFICSPYDFFTQLSLGRIPRIKRGSGIFILKIQRSNQIFYFIKNKKTSFINSKYILNRFNSVLWFGAPPAHTTSGFSRPLTPRAKTQHKRVVNYYQNLSESAKRTFFTLSQSWIRAKFHVIATSVRAVRVLSPC